MAEESFSKLFEESTKNIRVGEVVDGTVFSVTPDEAIMSVGYKYDAHMSVSAYADDVKDLTSVLHEGDTVQVKIMKIDSKTGEVIVSHKKAAQEKTSKIVEDAFNNQTVVTAPITSSNKGGICAEVDGVQVFIPASQVSNNFEKDLSKYVGQELSFLITEYDPAKHRIIGSRKPILAKEHAEKKKELLDSLKIGDVFEGKVKNITSFGAFVDIGGVDGLLHVTQMTWSPVKNLDPHKLFKPGDSVKVFVQDIKGEKISLSCKWPDQDPWLTAEDKYSVGTVVTGPVARLTDFGAFISLEDGIDGLLHVSQISQERIEKPSDVLKVGQEVTAVVTDFDPEKKRISLSMKNLQQDAAPENE